MSIQQRVEHRSAAPSAAADREHRARGWDLRGELFTLIDSLTSLRGLAAMDVGADREPELLARALDVLIAHPDLERCSIFLVERNRLTCVAGKGIYDCARDEGYHPDRNPTTIFEPGEGLIGLAARTGRLHHCADGSKDDRFAPRNLGGPPHGSLICAPMVTGDKVVGVVNAYHARPQLFHAWHEAIFSLFACTVAHIMSNNRVLRQLLDSGELGAAGPIFV